MAQPDAAGLLRDGVLLEWYRYPPGPPVVLPRHAHDEYQLNLNLDEPGGVHYRGAYHTVPANRLAVIMPGEAHAPALALDLTDPARIPAVVGEVIDRYGRLDVLVNNAGYALIGAAEETTDRELRDLMEVHFFGPAALTRAVLPHLRRQGSGAIVQISSMGGRLSFAGVSAYTASKFALEGLSEGLAAEVAPFGIRVLIVEPGAFRTGLHGASRRESAALAAYEKIVGPVRAAQAGFDGAQPGGPAKAAAAILAALDADEPPLRLPLGNDAADAISAALDRARAEFQAWESVTRGTDIDTTNDL